MKRIIAIIAVIVLCLPLFGVRALTESTNYFTFKKGELVNFYINENGEKTRSADTTGATSGIILEDKGANEKYVRVLLLSGGGGGVQFYDSALDGPTIKTKGSFAWKRYTDSLGELEFATPYIESIGDPENEHDVDFLTLNEAVDLFGATKNSDVKYTIDINKTISTTDEEFGTLKGVFNHFAMMNANGFFLGTTEGNNVWAVKYTKTGDDVTGATIELFPATSSQFGLVGVAYMNKTADCHERSYACYVCDGTYGIMVEGTQDASCTIVPNVTTAEECVAKYCYNCNDTYVWKTEGTQDATCTKVDTVTSEANCVKSPKTGVESHILEFAIVAALCAIALLVVKRKDLFRTI